MSSAETVPHPNAPKAKKSVALSGVVAGNTALCTVGRTGNDLHYRGYDILDIAETCEFEEIAYLLVHGHLPNTAELKSYKDKLKSLRGLPANVKAASRVAARRLPSDGCDANWCLGAWLHAARKGRPQPSWRARHRRPSDGFVRVNAALLVSLLPQRQAHRGRDGR